MTLKRTFLIGDKLSNLNRRVPHSISGTQQDSPSGNAIKSHGCIILTCRRMVFAYFSFYVPKPIKIKDRNRSHLDMNLKQGGLLLPIEQTLIQSNNKAME
jgi:hypothetical protein